MIAHQTETNTKPRSIMSRSLSVQQLNSIAITTGNKSSGKVSIFACACACYYVTIINILMLYVRSAIRLFLHNPRVMSIRYPDHNRPICFQLESGTPPLCTFFHPSPLLSCFLFSLVASGYSTHPS